jgi:hypothetical protein
VEEGAPELALLWPPQPMTAVIAIAQAMNSIIAFRRRKGGARNNTANATMLPPPHSRRALVVEALVVLTVTVAVAVPPDVITTLAGFTLQVGRLWVPAGEAVSAQLRLSVPEYVLPADKEAVAVPVPPGAIAGAAGTVTTRGATLMVVVPLAEP